MRYFKHTPETGSYVFNVRVARDVISDGALDVVSEAPAASPVLALGAFGFASLYFVVIRVYSLVSSSNPRTRFRHTVVGRARRSRDDCLSQSWLVVKYGIVCRCMDLDCADRTRAHDGHWRKEVGHVYPTFRPLHEISQEGNILHHCFILTIMVDDYSEDDAPNEEQRFVTIFVCLTVKLCLVRYIAISKTIV